MPGLFVLGSFARSVTVYSQQVRALNLVDALCGMGYLRRSTRVAVVGAGFGGITAAAALAKIGVYVWLFEKEVPMHLQRNSSKRYLHPHIYDWPFKEINDVEANLLVLNWKADYAKNVAKDVDSSWQEIRRQAGEKKVKERFRTEVSSISRHRKEWKICTGDSHEESFDIVILAVGFGVERYGGSSYSYWADIPIDDSESHKRKWLVSGAGDGALTDVMRLCISNCDHGKTLERVVEAITIEAGPAFLEELRERVGKGVAGTKLFDGLDHSKITKRLEGESKQYLRNDPVKLNATEESVFGREGTPPRASVLNRLVTWIMLNSEKIELVDGHIKNIEEDILGKRGNFTVTLTKDGQRDVIECDEVLLRHGPVPVLSSGKEGANWLSDRIVTNLGRQQRKWIKLYEEMQPDPTLATGWPSNAFQKDRLAQDFKHVAAMLLYSSSAFGKGETVEALGNSVDAVLGAPAIRTQFNEATGYELPRNVRVERMSVDNALRDARSLGRTLQCLCDAPVLIADITEESPNLLFILGVRSAVRRGVTIVFRVGELGIEAWQNMAFSLRELRIVSVPDRSSVKFEKPVKIALEEGLRRYKRRPFHYMDLPGFDALRNLGPHEDDYSSRTLQTEVLVLCPFDSRYENLCWPAIQRALRDEKDDQGPARRVIDVESPEIMGRRLFEAIRRDSECVVDTTMSRLNVFFELGVRVAAHERGARLIRCVDFQDSIPHDVLDVERLLGVHDYHVKNGSTVSEALDLGNDWPGGEVSAGYPFDVIQRCIFVHQEAGGTSVLDMLWRSVESVTGKDRQRQAKYPILYASNHEIRAQTEQFAFEALLAYVLLSAQINKSNKRKVSENRRSIALADLKHLLDEMDVDENEKRDFKKLIKDLEKPDEP